MKLRQKMMLAPALLAGLATGHAAGIYVCRDGGRIEYRDHAHGADCRKAALAPVGRIDAVETDQVVAPPPAAETDTQGAARAVLRERLASERARQDELRRAYNDGEPERRGDERNYAKYQQRSAALKTALEESEAKAAALEQALKR